MNARAISGVLSPPTVRRVSATRASSGSAGWAQVNTSRRRSSQSGPASALSSGPLADGSRCSSTANSLSFPASTPRRRGRSMARLRAAVVTSGSGVAGRPVRGRSDDRLPRGHGDPPADASGSSSTSTSAEPSWSSTHPAGGCGSGSSTCRRTRRSAPTPADRPVHRGLAVQPVHGIRGLEAGGRADRDARARTGRRRRRHRAGAVVHGPYQPPRQSQWFRAVRRGCAPQAK